VDHGVAGRIDRNLSDHPQINDGRAEFGVEHLGQTIS
jgi:hypothetical protein